MDDTSNIVNQPACGNEDFLDLKGILTSIDYKLKTITVEVPNNASFASGPEVTDCRYSVSKLLEDYYKSSNKN